MKILALKFSDPHESGLSTEVQFNEGMNLIVGPSGSGKTRVLNIIFNIARMGCGRSQLGPGEWTLEFSHNSKNYIWSAKIEKKKGPLKIGEVEVSVISEQLLIDSNDGRLQEVFFSSDQKSIFSGEKSPKIVKGFSAISIYREENLVADAYAGLSKIIRRNFAGDDLSMAFGLESFPYSIMNNLSKIKHRKAQDIFNVQMGIHSKIYILEKYFPSVLRQISEQYKIVFPKFEKFSLRSSQQISGNVGFDAPIVLLHEKGVANGTSISDISSGMQKVLLIIADILCFPPDALYLIDEYENSLGANAIDFLPLFIAAFGKNIQFLITTHHPVLINEIPPQSWLIFKRIGSNINVSYGHEMVEKYGASKQKLFVQLLNDASYES